MDGLFGDRGVLPLASRAAKLNPENFLVDPSLIWVGKFVGLSLAETAEVLALVGGIAGKVLSVRFKNLCITHVGILSWGNLIYTNSYIDFSVLIV